MTTYAELRAKVAVDLRDEDNKVFSDAVVGDMVNAAVVEIGRIAPAQYQEDITLVADTLEYQLRSDYFSAVAVPELYLTRVEIWDGSQTPAMPVKVLQPLDAEFSRSGEAGWKVWGGILSLPRQDWAAFIDGYEDDYILRTWGYSPYPEFTADDDVVPFGFSLTQAVRQYCTVEALRRLIGSRVLFTQWQTRTNNSDISPASLMNDYNIALDEWRRKAKAIAVLREAP